MAAAIQNIKAKEKEEQKKLALDIIEELTKVFSESDKDIETFITELPEDSATAATVNKLIDLLQNEYVEHPIKMDFKDVKNEIFEYCREKAKNKNAEKTAEHFAESSESKSYTKTIKF